MDLPPHINWLEPVDERIAAGHLSTQLGLLHYLEDQFRSAVELVEHAEGLIATMKARGGPGDEIQNRARVANWKNIAGTHAAINLSNFRDAIFAVAHAMRECPSRQAQVDMKLLERVPSRFEEAFPFYKAVRDGTAHFVGKVFAPEDIEAHRPAEKAFMHGVMQGRTLTFTVDGKHVGLDVTAENLAKLSAVKTEVYSAFRRAVLDT